MIASLDDYMYHDQSLQCCLSACEALLKCHMIGECLVFTVMTIYVLSLFLSSQFSNPMKVWLATLAQAWLHVVWVCLHYCKRHIAS